MGKDGGSTVVSWISRRESDPKKTLANFPNLLNIPGQIKIWLYGRSAWLQFRPGPLRRCSFPQWQIVKYLRHCKHLEDIRPCLLSHEIAGGLIAVIIFPSAWGGGIFLYATRLIFAGGFETRPYESFSS
jgi:hypothetical protein